MAARLRPVVEDVEDAAYRWMGDLAGEVDLRLEPLDGMGVGSDFGQHCLESDVLAGVRGPPPRRLRPCPRER